MGRCRAEADFGQGIRYAVRAWGELGLSTAPTGVAPRLPQGYCCDQGHPERDRSPMADIRTPDAAIPSSAVAWKNGSARVFE